jgi:hypothetical protein
VPALFIISVVAFVANALVNDTLNTVITFALILSGVPIYYGFFLRDRRQIR